MTAQCPAKSLFKPRRLLEVTALTEISMDTRVCFELSQTKTNRVLSSRVESYQVRMDRVDRVGSLSGINSMASDETIAYIIFFVALFNCVTVLSNITVLCSDENLLCSTVPHKVNLTHRWHMIISFSLGKLISIIINYYAKICLVYTHKQKQSYSQIKKYEH